jgi:hypothetical protein
MFIIPGTTAVLPAVLLERRSTSASNAWRASYTTVRLTADLPAVRVHVGAGEGAATRRELVAGAGLHGKWFAIGDIVQTYDEYRASRALPSHFTQIAWATLLPGTVVNVGCCGPLFGLRGGGEQAEFLEGPPPRLRPTSSLWSRHAGHA